MSDNNELLIYQNVVRDMSEGVMTIGMNGRITALNSAGMKILGMGKSIVGKIFANCFFEYKENDAFVQIILDAIYDGTTSHNSAVDYFDGYTTKKIFANTSYIRNGDDKIGVAVVLNDITEIEELRDALLAMEKIKSLNAQLTVRNEFIKKTFGRYLSDEIVTEILDKENGLEIGGKKQSVTVMFSDIRGFTAISEKTAPHDLISLLNHYLAGMIDIIVRHRGTILEFIGDAIVAVFGAPLESDTKDTDAVECAIEMQCAMEAINEYNTSRGWPELEMGIGIHTGDVVLGNIGSERKMKYDIIGKNVNLASRIESSTVGGQILISPVTRAALGERLLTRGEIEIIPKGVNHPITIYDVKSLGNYAMPDNTEALSSFEPFDIYLRKVDGKSVSEKSFAATVISLSKKEAALECGTPLNIGENITFSFEGDEIFAKVISKTAGSAIIHYTRGKIPVRQ